MRSIHVVAGILQDDDGRVLLAERIGDSPFAGLWEFPGGKVNDGESPAAALKRELCEELGIAIASFEHLMNVQHEYNDRSVTLEFYVVNGWSGEPDGLDGQRLRWAYAAALHADELLPADAPVLAALQSPVVSRC
jgi:8-oxo-dGTP diphosphatase